MSEDSTNRSQGVRQIYAKVIADSISPLGKRVTTMEWHYPRLIHAQVMTYRMFSRNTASGRAIPTRKLIEQVERYPYIPDSFGSNQPGMQPGDLLDAWKQESARWKWQTEAMNAARTARELLDLGVHKQWANRILEPYLWHTAVVTATSFDNFFNQRCHPDAQEEIQVLANAARSALQSSTPKDIGYGQWHLPYLQPDDSGPWMELVKICVARCARVSYLTHDGRRDPSDDLKLYDKLASAQPPHLSPMEHICTPSTSVYDEANLKGWKTMRRVLENVQSGVVA
jgi:hypothetical protein